MTEKKENTKPDCYIIGKDEIPEGDYCFLWLENPNTMRQHKYLPEYLTGSGYVRCLVCGPASYSFRSVIRRIGWEKEIEVNDFLREEKVQELLANCLMLDEEVLRCTFLTDDAEQAEAFLQPVKEKLAGRKNAIHLTEGYEFCYQGKDGVISIAGDALILWNGRENRFRTAVEALEAQIFGRRSFLDILGDTEEKP